MEVLGRDKVPVDQATDKDLDYWAGRIQQELADPEKARFHAAGERKLAAIEAERARRKGGGAPVVAQRAPAAQPAPRAANTALARASNAGLASGTVKSGPDVTERLREAAKVAHVVTPSMSCDVLPEGCSVVLSVVYVDVAAETYPIPGGKRGLSKVALDRISAAAGISWDATQSHRVDDGRDPRYCCFSAVGSYRQFDGKEIQIADQREMDLRDGSDQVAEIRAKAKDDATAVQQLRDMRRHILSHAITKARLRAIRTLGIRTSYTERELEKPFVVAQLMFTGHSDDPEIRLMFASKRADAMLGGGRALYGVPPVPAALPAARRYVSAPPVGSTRYDDDDEVEALPPARQRPAAPPPVQAPDDGPSEADIARMGEIDRGDDPEAY